MQGVFLTPARTAGGNETRDDGWRTYIVALEGCVCGRLTFTQRKPRAGRRARQVLAQTLASDLLGICESSQGAQGPLHCGENTYCSDSYFVWNPDGSIACNA